MTRISIAVAAAALALLAAPAASQAAEDRPAQPGDAAEAKPPQAAPATQPVLTAAEILRIQRRSAAGRPQPAMSGREAMKILNNFLGEDGGRN